jgi:hypothetical protein
MGGCELCPDEGKALGATIGYSFLLIAVISLLFYVLWRSEDRAVPKHDHWKIVKDFRPESRVNPNFQYNLKILLGFFQVATTVVGITEIPWPSAFAEFLSALSWINLDFLP